MAQSRKRQECVYATLLRPNHSNRRLDCPSRPIRTVDSHYNVGLVKKGKGSPYSIIERRVPELIPVLGNQPAGDVSHKPDCKLPLLSARPAVTSTTLKRAATSFAAWWTEAQWVWTVCLRLSPDSVAATIWTRALLRLSPARKPLGYRATTSLYLILYSDSIHVTNYYTFGPTLATPTAATHSATRLRIVSLSDQRLRRNCPDTAVTPHNRGVRRRGLAGLRKVYVFHMKRHDSNWSLAFTLFLLYLADHKQGGTENNWVTFLSLKKLPLHSGPIPLQMPIDFRCFYWPAEHIVIAGLSPFATTSEIRCCTTWWNT